MAEEKEETIEKVQPHPKAKPEAADDELSETDLESVTGASIVNCATRQTK